MALFAVFASHSSASFFFRTVYVDVCDNQVGVELLEVIYYLLEHGAKPETFGLIRLSTRVQFGRLKVGTSMPRGALVLHIGPK